MPIATTSARAVAATLAAGCALGAAVAIGPRTAMAQGGLTATAQTSGTNERLIAVSAATANIVWAAGEHGTFVHTTDGGETWIPGHVAGAERLQFRDVYAVDGKTAYLLSIGNADSSRIYKTVDGGATWQLQYTNRDATGFYDCFDFWDSEHGVLTGDAVNGELVILTTSDGGLHWTRVAPSTLPPALAKEGSFASSGTCVVTQRNGHAWIGTSKSRVLRSTDFGKTWKVSFTAIPVTDTTGVTSVAFRDEKNGLAFGGFGAAPSDMLVVATEDGGASWIPRGRPPFKGGIYGGAYVTSALTPTVVVVGPGGSAYSRDHGVTWTSIDDHNYWGLGFASGNRGWAVGSNGRITRLAGF